MKKYIYIIFSILLLTNSCSLDIDLPNELSDKRAVTDDISARNIIVDAYLYIPKDVNYGLSILSEDFMPTVYLANNNPEDLNLYEYNEKAIINFSQSLWDNYYVCISKINTAIDLCNKYYNKTKSKVAERILGEAYAMKAYCYFNLLQLFSTRYTNNKDGQGIIIRNDVPTESKEAMSKENTIKDIIKLLTDAELLLSDKDCSNNLILNKISVLHILARTYQYLGDYDKCLEITDKYFNLVNRDNLKISVYDQDFWSGKKTNYSDWSLQIKDEQYYTSIFSQNKEKKEFQNFVVNPKLSISKENKGYGIYQLANDTIKKHQLSSNVIGKYNLINSLTDEHIKSECELRSSEMIYIEAEALIEKNQITKAEDILSKYYDQKISLGNNISDAINKFFKLKSIEFLGEGINYYDLKRRNIPKDILNVRGNTKRTIKQDNFKWTLPLPPKELKFNSYVKQNTGWPNYNLKQ